MSNLNRSPGAPVNGRLSPGLNPMLAGPAPGVMTAAAEAARPSGPRGAWCLLSWLPAAAAAALRRELGPGGTWFLNGRPVELRPYGPVWALVAAVEPSDYAPAAGRTVAFEEPTWLAARVAEYHQVLVRAAETGTVAPVPFPALFWSLERIGQLAAQQAARLASYFARYPAHREWTVAMRAAPAGVPGSGKIASPVAESCHSTGPGRDFLARFRDRERSRREAQSECDQAWQEAQRAWRPWLDSSRELTAQAAGADRRLTLLVARASEPAWRQAVEEWAAASPRAVEVTLSGPWPPYTFSPAGLAAEEDRAAVSGSAAAASGPRAEAGLVETPRAKKPSSRVASAR